MVIFSAAVAGVITGAPAAAATPRSMEDLQRLSIEELTTVEITSVFKRPEPLSRTPASVYVISEEDIRRSGAISLPEVLRLAPNLHVTRLDSSNYSISARGFNSFEAANKLLVLIDGRSIYSPLHGGVFWDQQQVMLEDISRIEVVSGPGGTLWGANAVNGIINIITKSAWDSKGGLASLQFGTDRRAAARYGGTFGELGAWRAYAQGFEYQDSVDSDGDSAGDDWDGWQAGFRTDWNIGPNAFTFQGDFFENDLSMVDLSGGNILARWARQLGDRSALEVQAYYDAVDRLTPGVTDKLETFDVEAQHSFPLGTRHEIVWGGGYRITDDEFARLVPLTPDNPFVLDPERDTIRLGNVFVQDSITLNEDLILTLGTKFEYSSYSGFEYLPSARLAWQVSDTAMLWGAVSRAVRTPTRIDRDLTAPGFLDRATDLDSEELVAYELGYRGEPSENTSLSVSVFFNDYDELRSLSISPDPDYFFVLGNVMEGYTYGLEAWGDYQVNDWWRLNASLTLLEKNLDVKTPGIEAALDQHGGNDPEYKFSLRSQMDLTRDVKFDVGLRAIDDLPDPDVPAYVAVDARMAWQMTDALELSLAVFNLFDEHHPEAGDPATRREVPRSVYVAARLTF